MQGMDTDTTPSSCNNLGILAATSVEINSSVLDHCPRANIVHVPQGATTMFLIGRTTAHLKDSSLNGNRGWISMGFIPTSRSHTARPSRVDPQNNFVKVHVCANGDITVKQGYTKDDNLIIDRLDALILTYTIQFNTTGKLDNFSSTFNAIAQLN